MGKQARELLAATLANDDAAPYVLPVQWFGVRRERGKTRSSSAGGDGQFLRAVVLVGGGTALAQCFALIVSPALTRLFLPEHFGIAAIFTAALSLATPVGTLGFHLGISIEEDEERVDALLGLCLGISTVFAIATAVLLLIVEMNEIGPPLFFSKLRPTMRAFMWFPLGVWGSSCLQALSAYAARRRAYQELAQVSTIRAVIQATVQLGLGASKWASGASLAGGMAIASVVASLRMFSKIPRKTLRTGCVLWRSVARRYVSLAGFSTFGAFLSLASLHVAPILLAYVVGLKDTGQFSLALRVLGLPSMLLGTAVARVFYPELARLKSDPEASAKLTGQVALHLGCIAVVVYGQLMLWSPNLFEFIFGTTWRPAGELAVWLSPGFAAYFVTMPLSSLVLIHRRERQHMFAAALLLALRIVGLLIGALHGGVVGAAIAYSVTSWIHAVFWILWIRRLSCISLRGFLRQHLAEFGISAASVGVSGWLASRLDSQYWPASAATGAFFGVAALAIVWAKAQRSRRG